MACHDPQLHRLHQQATVPARQCGTSPPAPPLGWMLVFGAGAAIWSALLGAWR